MPYIKQEARERLLSSYPENCGEFNYDVTHAILKYIARHGESYQIYNDIIGALECAKLEVYRRKIAPYEDKKMIENGDVYYDA